MSPRVIKEDEVNCEETEVVFCLTLSVKNPTVLPPNLTKDESTTKLPPMRESSAARASHRQTGHMMMDANAISFIPDL
jgi:hypothetical protein